VTRRLLTYLTALAGWLLLIASLALGCLSCLACVVLGMATGRLADAEVFGALAAISGTLLLITWPGRPYWCET
jgi:hypothetical protein